MQKRRNDLLAISFLLLINIIFFNKIIFLKEFFYDVDIVYAYFPARIYAAEVFPLWTRYLQCGYPLLAEGHIAYFYPFSLLFKFLNPVIAFNYIIVIHYFFLSFFTFLYCRKIKLNINSSLLASVIFSYNGFALAHFRHINIITTITFLPLILIFAEDYIKRKKRTSLIKISLILALQFFAYFPQITFYTLIILFVYFFLRINFPRNIFLFLIVVLVFIFMAAVQLFPTFELVLNSVRASGIDKNRMQIDAFNWQQLKFLFFPNIFQEKIPWELSGYLGIFSWPFLIFAILKSKSNFKLVFLLVFVISLMAILGNNFFLSKFLFNLPVYKYFGAPARMLFLLSFSASILVAIGFSYFNIKPILKFLFIFLFLIDFYFFSFKKNIVTINNYNNLVNIPKVAFLLHQDKNVFRIASIANKDFFPNKNLLYGLESINIYTPLMLKNFWDIAYEIYFKNNNYLFSLLNVKYIFLKKSPKVIINEEVLPRFYLVYKTKNFNSNKKLFKYLISQKFNPQKEILLLKNIFPENINSSASNKDFLKLNQYKNNIIEFINYNKNPSMLFLSDNYYPGWKVYVNDKEEKILLANYSFRGLYLSSGKHKITFIYKPLSFYGGFMISVVFIVITMIVIFLNYKLRL